MIKNVLKVLLLVSLCSCFEGNDTATGSLRNFVKRVSANSLSQEDYSDYAQGDLLDSILAMDEEEFKSYQEQSTLDGVQLDILSENCSKTNCTITYLTKYTSKTSDGSSYNSEVRKIAELEKFDEAWKVISVQNVKTYLEAQEGLNPLKD